MLVREATIDDKELWNSFIDNENGNFYHYFDWKHVYETAGWQYIPLIIENPKSEIISIFPLARIEKKFYAKLISLPKGTASSFLFKKGLNIEDRHRVVTTVLERIDKEYAHNVSTFTIHHIPTLSNETHNEYLETICCNGFCQRNAVNDKVPCNYILKLSRPFEEHIWMKRWSKKFREQVRNCIKTGAAVLPDKDFNHAEVLIDMVKDTWQRNRENPPSRTELYKRIDVFKDKSRLFVAYAGGKPIVTALCHYTPTTCYLAIIASHTKDINRVNLLMNKTILEDACEKGYQWADFGYTPTPGLAHWKERFKPERLPINIYEKRYSISRKFVEKIPMYAKNAWQDKSYIWKNRHKVWDRIIHW